MTSFTFSLEVVPPFRLDLTAWVLRRMPMNRIDRIEEGVYRRLIVTANQAVEVFVSQPTTGARVDVHVSGTARTKKVQSYVTGMIEKMLGLRVNMSEFYAVAERDRPLAQLAERFVGVKPPRFPTVFEGVVNGIACQQLSLSVGLTLLTRLSETCAPSLRAETGEQVYAFPRPQDMLRLSIRDFRGMGFSTRKAEFLLAIARDVTAGRLDLERLAAVGRDAALEYLESIRGIGRWTAEYVALRSIGDLSTFPGDDVGGRNRLQRLMGIKTPLSYEAVRTITSRWSPFPGFVYFHLLLDELQRKGYIEEKMSV